MTYTLTFECDPMICFIGGVFGGGVSLVTSAALTSLNPLYGLVYGIGTGILSMMAFNSLGESAENNLTYFSKRIIEFSASSLLSLALLQLLGIPLAFGQAALLSGAILTVFGVIYLAKKIFWGDPQIPQISPDSCFSSTYHPRL